MSTLANKYRPKKFSDVIGQDEAVRVVKGLSRTAFPHFVLLTGPSGCGKTTIARIIANKLGCEEHDFVEVNAASYRGIDFVRSIENQMMYKPLHGPCRVWLYDEVHQISSDAQSSFLKILEDTPSHVYFLFCTTDPQKLKPTIVTRATVINLKSVDTKQITALVQKVHNAEVGTDLSEDVCDRLADLASGSPRKALVLLGQVIGAGETDEEKLQALTTVDSKTDAIAVARLLLKPRASWMEMAKVLSSIVELDEQAEKIRWLVLSYMSSVALKGGKSVDRACYVIECFRDNFYDSKRAGLIAACWECLKSEDGKG